jgi:glutamate formiminotransferase/formiminotetrahydrofolate cyclodeaminase
LLAAGFQKVFYVPAQGKKVGVHNEVEGQYAQYQSQGEIIWVDANLSSHKRGWDDRWEFFAEYADKGALIQQELIHLVDEDTRSFNVLMDAFRLPNGNDSEKIARKEAIQKATQYAAEVPLKVMQTSLKGYDILEAMAEHGMESSISDIGVGALCLRTCVTGAWLNVRINAQNITDETFKNSLLGTGSEVENASERKSAEILGKVNGKIK